MPIIDDIKEQTLKAKDMTWKQRLQYFWGYYKFHTIAVVAIITIVTWIIHDMVTQKEEAFYALMLNAGGYNMSRTAGDEFGEYAGIDMKEYDVVLDTSVNYNPENYSQDSYYNAMKVSALLAAGDLDVMTCADSLFYTYALNESFAPLEDVLTEEEIERYGLDVYYIDREEIRQNDEQDPDMYADPESSAPKMTKDPRDPSQMVEPVAVGLYLDVESIPFFMENQCYMQGEVVYGFVINSDRTQMGIKFLDYLTTCP